MDLFEELGVRGSTASPDAGTAWEAEFSRSISAVATGAYVRIPSLDAESEFGPAPWPIRVNDAAALVYPQKGDRALLVFSDVGEPWITAWQPAAYDD